LERRPALEPGPELHVPAIVANDVGCQRHVCQPAHVFERAISVNRACVERERDGAALEALLEHVEQRKQIGRRTELAQIDCFPGAERSELAAERLDFAEVREHQAKQDQRRRGEQAEALETRGAGSRGRPHATRWWRIDDPHRRL
jgi:hypothetical protein